MNEARPVIAVFENDMLEDGRGAGIDNQYTGPFVDFCAGIGTEPYRIVRCSLCQDAPLDSDVMLSARQDLATRLDGERDPRRNHHIMVDNPGRVCLFQGQVIFNTGRQSVDMLKGG